MREEWPMPKTHLATRIGVTLVFALIYTAFLAETGMLVEEFGPSGLAQRLAALESQNFIFFPIAGLLALVAFWRPAVLLVDAMARGRLKYGRITLVASLVACGAAAWLIAGAFAVAPQFITLPDRFADSAAPKIVFASIKALLTAQSSDCCFGNFGCLLTL